jgi:tRNA(adenine34) deaminase
MIPTLLAAGHRVLAPDMIGFGKSDKPKKDSFHQLSFHRETLLQLVERLDLKKVVLVLQNKADLLGLSLPMAAPQRYVGLLLANTLPAASNEEHAADNAPFVDRGHRAALRAFPRLLSESPDAEGAALAQQARDFWAYQWSGKTLSAVDVADHGEGLAAEAVQFFNGG